MPKSPESPKNERPLIPEPTVDPVPETADKAAQTVVETSADPRDTAVPIPPEAPDVKVALSEDYVKQVEAINEEGVGDGVFVQVAELPEDLGENDRFKVPTSPTAVPAAVAAQLVESPAVEKVAD